jgi:hypothetical protein
VSVTLFAFCLLAAALPAATPAPEVSVTGEITALDASARRVSVRTDAGETAQIDVPEAAKVLRVKPGATNLEDAVPVAIGDAVVGDRALVRGRRTEDGATIVARRVVIMSGGDIARKNDAVKEDWRRRGIHGTVVSVDGDAGKILVRLGRSAEAPTLTVNVSSSDHPTVLRRYSPGSVKFSDARPSRLSDVRAGDELRALGNRSDDGNTLVAEQVVFGTFRFVTGPVASVDAEHGRLVVHDDETRQDVVVTTVSDSRLRRLPPEMAARLARRSGQGGGPGGGQGGGQGGGPGGWPGGAPGGGPAPEGGGQRPGGRGFSPEDMIERMPTVTLADLKAGDRILVSGAPAADAALLHAAVLVCGLEALAVPAAGPAGGSRRGGRGIDVGLPAELMDLGMSIP